MPVSKNALIRYKTIDRCLQNHYRRWTLDDLIEECSKALYEYEGRDEGVSRRTVQLDIQMMRSDKLGYNAPIKVVDHKYYIYEDPDFSITESPLSAQDVEKMGEAVKVLRQLSGFQEFAGMEGIVGRLEDLVHVAKEKSRPVIFFDKNDRLKGLEFIQPLHEAILDKKPVRMTYQSFRARIPNTFVFHPYALREFNNRWFIFGRRGRKDIENLALDRIVSLEDAPGVAYLDDPSFIPEVWFSDMVGVSKFRNDSPERVVIWGHALHNALIPVVTIVGLQFGHLLCGAMLTESIFAVPGVGRLMVTSIMARDYPMVQGAVLFVATAFSFVNLLVDILYAYVDPRIKAQYK